MTNAFGVNLPDRETGARLRAAQMRSFLRVTPYACLANLLNLVVISIATYGQVSLPVMVFWGVSSLSINVFGFWAWLQFRNSRSVYASRHRIRQAIAYSAALAFICSSIVFISYDVVTPVAQSFLVCLMAGLICAGSFVLATIPAAAIAWIWILAVVTGVTLALSGHHATIIPLVSSSVLVTGCVLSTASMFVARFLAQAELEAKGDLIHLLLNEFEESASDWLWETDADGYLQRVSPRLEAASGRNAEHLRTLRLSDLCGACRSDGNMEGGGGNDIETRMAAREHFRDVTTCIDVNGDRRWWSLSAKPSYDGQGLFRGYRGVGSDVTEARRSSDRASFLADHDALTAIGNRRWFEARLADIVDRAVASGNPAYLLIIDLDNFKAVNDTMGHPVGDEMLRETARRLNSLCGPNLQVARIGGDEFAIFGQFADPRDVGAFADSILKAIAEPISTERGSTSSGCTIGVASVPDDAQDVGDLMRAADMALYEAKAEGRGRYCIFERMIDEKHRARWLLEKDLRLALGLGQLELVYQPIVDAVSEEVMTFEALLRWNHPERGVVSPGVFIPLAEESGLIVDIGRWTIQKACQEAARWGSDTRVAINLSPAQFHVDDLVETIRQALDISGLQPDRLELEVTESLLIRDGSRVRRIMEELHDLGVRLSLDDFGTGYSSLSYLRDYPFNKMKIDMTFVAELGVRADSVPIVQAIITLAKSLRMETTAEGVEREDQALVLRHLGCDTFQGYLFGRPGKIPENSYERLAQTPLPLPVSAALP